jgi:hypothetical protein
VPGGARPDLAEEPVGAIAAIDDVVARARTDGIVAVAAIDDVIAPQAVNDIVAIGAGEDVIPRRADEGWDQAIAQKQCNRGFLGVGVVVEILRLTRPTQPYRLNNASKGAIFQAPVVGVRYEPQRFARALCWGSYCALARPVAAPGQSTVVPSAMSL